jgi:hypothetical protein
MSESLHDIDRYFHENLEGHSEKPSPAVWGGIEAGLDKETVVVYRNKYRRLKRAAVLIFMLLSGILAYEIISHNSGQRISVRSDDAKKETQNYSRTNEKKQADLDLKNKNRQKENDLTPEDQKNNSPEQPNNPVTGQPDKNDKIPVSADKTAGVNKNIPDNKNFSKTENNPVDKFTDNRSEKSIAENKKLPSAVKDQQADQQSLDKNFTTNNKKTAKDLNKKPEQGLKDNDKDIAGSKNLTGDKTKRKNKLVMNHTGVKNKVNPESEHKHKIAIKSKNRSENLTSHDLDKGIKTNEQSTHQPSLIAKHDQGKENKQKKEEQEPVNSTYDFTDLVSLQFANPELIRSGQLILPSTLLPGNNHAILLIKAPGNGTIAVPAIIHLPAASVAKSKKPVIRLQGHPLQGFSISASFSPNAKINLLKNDVEGHRGPQGHDDKDHIQNEEHNDFSYTAGLKITIPVGKKFALQSGFNYSSSVSSIIPKYIFAEQDNYGNVRYRFNCTSGYSYFNSLGGSTPSVGDSVLVSDSKNKVSYISVPMLLSYGITLGKFTLYLQPGIQANFLLSGKTSSVLHGNAGSESNVSVNTESLKPVYLSLVTGLSGEFKLGKNISIQLLPQGQFGITSINKGSVVRTHSAYLGMGAGLKIKL